MNILRNSLLLAVCATTPLLGLAFDKPLKAMPELTQEQVREHVRNSETELTPKQKKAIILKKKQQHNELETIHVEENIDSSSEEISNEVITKITNDKETELSEELQVEVEEAVQETHEKEIQTTPARITETPIQQDIVSRQKLDTFYVNQTTRIEEVPIAKELRNTIQQDIADDKTWVSNKIDELRSNTDLSTRTELRKEIIAHIKQRNVERKDKIVESAQLPSTPKKDTVVRVIDGYKSISQRLGDAGVDNSSLNASVEALEISAEGVEQAKDILEEERNFDNMKALQLALQELRSNTQEVRNQVQSLLNN